MGCGVGARAVTAVQLRALPEDGTIGHLAVAIAVSGSRRVQLTRAERQLASLGGLDLLH